MNTLDNKKRINTIALNGILLALILALQMVNLPNLVTGVVVNAVLVFILLYSGLRAAVTICLLSPLGALITGHMVGPMYPILPVIALGNVLLVVILKKIHNKATWMKLILPSLGKALLIGFGGMMVVKFFVPDNLANWLVLGVLGIQFFTAVPGIWLGIKLFNNFPQTNSTNS